MGRELKRVALNFDWPIGETWAGYLNPYYDLDAGCQACGGNGYSHEAKHLNDQWYGNAEFDPSETGSTPLTIDHPAVRDFAGRNVARSPDYYGTGEDAIRREATRLSDMWNGMWSLHLDADDVAALASGNSLMDLTHERNGKRWVPKEPAPILTPAIIQDFSIRSAFGTSGGAYVCVKAKCERLGVPHLCAECNGSGEKWKCGSSKWLAEEAWQKIEPPAGEAYQIWQTVSEGGPVSPPFETPEELARWMVTNDTSITQDTGYEGWMRFINGPGWAPSAIGRDGEVKSGVAAITASPPTRNRVICAVSFILAGDRRRSEAVSRAFADRLGRPTKAAWRVHRRLATPRL